METIYIYFNKKKTKIISWSLASLKFGYFPFPASRKTDHLHLCQQAIFLIKNTVMAMSASGDLSIGRIPGPPPILLRRRTLIV
jgi:hypothetical protein